MDISIQSGAITASTRSFGSTQSSEPQGLSPIPGILDAPNVVILGASIMDAAFGSGQVLNPALQAYAQAAGFTGTLHARSQAGEKIVETITRHAGAAAEPAVAATQGQNLYVVHTGGNDVSGSRPFPNNQAGFTAEYQALMQQITATDMVVPLPLTKRLYTNAPEVFHGDEASEANGSAPYNEDIIYAAIDQYAPDWRFGGKAPFVNPYELADQYPHLLNSDGIHGYGASLGRFILARLAGRALGKASGQSRAGAAILYSPQKGAAADMTIGSINRFMSYGTGNGPGQFLLCGAVTTDGAFDPFIHVLSGDDFQNESNNAGTGTYARIADTRFHDPEVVNNGIYVQGTKTYDLHFENLTPGDTVTVSAVGVRNAGGTTRRGRLTLSTGQSLDLDASNVATSNQVTFAPVAVPADGKLSLSVAVAPGSTYGYLHGVLLEFS